MDRLQAVVDVVARAHGRVPTEWQRRRADEWRNTLVAQGYDEIEAMKDAALLALGITLKSPYGSH